jgi:hypothetical protein
MSDDHRRLLELERKLWLRRCRTDFTAFCVEAFILTMEGWRWMGISGGWWSWSGSTGTGGAGGSSYRSAWRR